LKGVVARSALYCPGDRPDRFDKARFSGADILILDLQDSVAANQKLNALGYVSEYLSSLTVEDRRTIQVRVDSKTEVPTELVPFAKDLAIRLPQVEHPDDLSQWSEFREIIALVESARGIRRIDDIATSSLVSALAIGELDLTTELGGNDPSLINHLRIELLLASAAAELPAPMMSAWTQLSNQEGLRKDCDQGLALGFAGRTAIHPKQVEVINRVFSASPSEDRATRALGVLGTQGGVGVDEEGNMIDAAMLRIRRNKFSD
jgi:citrate lyase subunit beta / citryl-CoA lyase